MGMFNIRSITFVGLIVGSLASAGCYAEPYGVGVGVEAEPAAVEGYQPQYYDGYVVYYDDVGRPFYYLNGAAVFIPEASPYYAGYVNYYRTYGVGYRRWYAGYGARYRTWRGRGGYYGYRGNVYRGGYRGGYVRRR